MLSRTSLYLTLALALGFTSRPATAGVINVRGPNSNFTQIKVAVNAAADGDVIRIWPGTYNAFGINNKSLSLVSQSGTSSVHVNGTLRVRNLDPGRLVTLSGINAVGADGYGLAVSDCQGSVRIRDGEFEGASAPNASSFYHGSTGAILLNCQDVVLTNCVVLGGQPGWDNNAGAGGDGLLAGSGGFSLFNCSFTGASGTTEDTPGESGHAGGTGLRHSGTGGLIYASGCTMTGGHGSSADYDIGIWTGEYGYGGNGGDGFRSTSSSEAWFLDCTFTAGQGGSSPNSSNAGSDGTPRNGGTLLPGDARLLWASPLVDDQSPIIVQFQGTPGERVSLRVSTGVGYAFDSLLGPHLLARPTGPALASWRILGQIAPNGSLQAQLSPRDLPYMGYRLLHLQGRVTGVGTDFTAASWSVVLDSAW